MKTGFLGYMHLNYTCKGVELAEEDIGCCPKPLNMPSEPWSAWANKRDKPSRLTNQLDLWAAVTGLPLYEATLDLVRRLQIDPAQILKARSR
jgi:hypothetical protein